MKKLSILFFAFSLSIISCKNYTENSKKESIKPKTVQNKTVSVTLTSKSNSNVVGTVVFSEENGFVKMNALITGLDPGEHAIHIHESSDCSSPDGTSAGGHWNPTNQPHGKWGDTKGYHKGDIGNLIADEEGEGSYYLLTDQWCIDCGDQTKDIIGKAIIVHAGIDDFTTQPTGNAGGRISCGGIIK